jgi:transcriptional regulator with XRE-family HTH domain
VISNIEIGQYISKCRKSLGLSQKQLADKLFISFQAISKWETGESLPNVSMIMDLADILNTTVDKILLGGNILMRKTKVINIDNIKEGFKSLENMKYYFGEKSTFYLGAIEGINNKMNIDFEEYMKNSHYREVFLVEVIIQYLMNGYTVERADVINNIKSEKLRNIIYKYLGEEDTMKHLYYKDNKELFDLIRSLEPEFKELKELNELPGEYIGLEAGKLYWGTQIETEEGFCYGIATDNNFVWVFSYEEGGLNNKQIHKIDLNKKTN